MRKIIFALLILLVAFRHSVAQPTTTGNLLRFDADPAKGFNFPYFLYIPAKISKSDSTYLLVESNNTGFANDTLAVHEEAAKVQATLGPLGHYFSEQLKTPLLVPVFPRPAKKWKLYTHLLDRDVMCLKKGVLRRLDLQLEAMIESSITELQKQGYKMHDQILMSGYSSSGVFANRFALLHPRLVKAYSAGGINGLLMMPFAKWNDLELDYPLGTSDYQTITNEPFDFDAFQRIHQFLYMGEDDTNDAVLMEDGYSDKERQVIFSAFGEKMQPDRWFACQLQYKVATHNAQFRTYSGVGHAINEDILRELVRFYEKVIHQY